MEDHYRNLDTEPICVMEQVLKNLDTTKLSSEQKLNIVLGLKYILRLGMKDKPEKELEKAYNYLHRAMYGSWVEKT